MGFKRSLNTVDTHSDIPMRVITGGISWERKIEGRLQALVTGKPSPSLATLKRYADALGKRLEVRFI